jgi:hypothetical protein
MQITVVDGQGGGIGKAIIEKLRSEIGEEPEILALGTNALATALMLKAGANEGASGENAIVWNVPKANIIVGSVAILAANSMLGELTPKMAAAISESPAKKILIPLNRSQIYIAGVNPEPLPHYVSYVADLVKKMIRGD